MSHQTRLADRLAFIELDDSAAQRLKGMKDVLTAALPDALDRFYSKIEAEPATRAVLANPGVLHRTKGRQRAHWDRVAAGQFDHRYLAAVTRVAEAHARIGLEPHWHIGGYAILMEQLVKSILAERWPKTLLGRRRSGADDVAADIGAVIKAVFLDIDLAVAVYLQAIGAAGTGSAASAGPAPASMPLPASQALGTALAALSIGDLTHRIEAALPDGHDSLREDYNLALDRLQGTVAQLVETTDDVMGGAEQIARVTTEASRRADKQEAGLRQTAAGLKAVTCAADGMAGAAALADHRLSEAEAKVEAARSALEGAAAVMDELDPASGPRAGMLAVIEEMAMQVQVLAMGAGLEAARAGDAGRGFGAIAADLHRLAQRSAATTREIKGVAARSGRAAEGGARLVSDGHAALRGMSAELAEAKAVIADLAATARTQEQGLRQIGMLAANLGDEAQESASLCQQGATLSTDLAEHATAQLRLARRFRIARSVGVQAPPKRRPLTVVRQSDTSRQRAVEDKRPMVSLRVINGGLAERSAPSRKPGL